MVVIGIDPGVSGAVAIFDGAALAVVDIPTQARRYGKGNEVSPAGLGRLLGPYRDRDCVIVLEQVNAMPPTGKPCRVCKRSPSMGATSAFHFGEGVGVIRGVAAALEIPIAFVLPQVWKRKAGLISKDKDAARTLAMELFPHYADSLAWKKDIGRADAILIAKFGLDPEFLTDLPSKIKFTTEDIFS